MAQYDAKSFIDLIEKNTGVSTVTWIGHSQGTTQLFYALSSHLQDWFEPRINLFVGLGPISRINNLESSFLRFISPAPIGPAIIWVSDLLGIYEYFGELAHFWTKVVCSAAPDICAWGLTLTDGTDPWTYNDPVRLQTYMGHLPSGASVRSMNHYRQLYQDQKFQMYDFGSDQNQNKYGKKTPPEIDITRIKNTNVPIGMVVGLEDELSSELDTRWMRDTIGKKNVVFYQEIHGGHTSFNVGKDMSYMNNVIDLV